MLLSWSGRDGARTQSNSVCRGTIEKRGSSYVLFVMWIYSLILPMVFLVFRSDNFGSYEITQWETCQSTGDECLLDWTSPSNSAAFSPPRRCLQGSVPNYYVWTCSFLPCCISITEEWNQIDVLGPDDIRAAFAFTKKTKVPIVIKNSGVSVFFLGFELSLSQIVIHI